MREVCARVRSLQGIRGNPLKANPTQMRRHSHRQPSEGDQVAFGSRDACIGARLGSKRTGLVNIGVAETCSLKRTTGYATTMRTKRTTLISESRITLISVSQHARPACLQVDSQLLASTAGMHPTRLTAAPQNTAEGRSPQKERMVCGGAQRERAHAGGAATAMIPAA